MNLNSLDVHQVAALGKYREPVLNFVFGRRAPPGQRPTHPPALSASGKGTSRPLTSGLCRTESIVRQAFGKRSPPSGRVKTKPLWCGLRPALIPTDGETSELDPWTKHKNPDIPIDRMMLGVACLTSRVYVR